MDTWNLISGLISGILTAITNLAITTKTLLDTKKFIEDKVMPDIKTEDKAEEIVRKQELAKSLVVLTGIESAYDIARGLIIALNFALIMHYAHKFTAKTVSKNEELQPPK